MSADFGIAGSGLVAHSRPSGVAIAGPGRTAAPADFAAVVLPAARLLVSDG
jgi:hypothetical protein